MNQVKMRSVISNEIRTAIAYDTRHQADIAKEYGINKATIYSIQRRVGAVYPFRPTDPPAGPGPIQHGRYARSRVGQN